jgi:hypothetical protein
MTSSAVAQSPVTVLPAAPFAVDVLGRGQASDPFLGLDPRWTHIERVPFGAAVVIDHVVMSAAGVYVATLASTVDAWTASWPASARAISEARWRGRKIEFLLRGAGRPRVAPMLLLDGPGTPAIPGGYEVVDGVLVCHRADARWLCAHLDALSPTPAPGRITEWVGLIADHTRRTGPADRTSGRRHWIATTGND